jgi:bacterioferritin-associated ferredoxin
MIICVCRRISDRDIVRHARAGMGFDEIQFELGVATQCGRCEGCARDVVAQRNPPNGIYQANRSSAGKPRMSITTLRLITLPTSLLVVVGAAWWVLGRS